MLFFLSLLVDGALAGAIYALIALAFVVVYKASRMMNFAVGECVMLGSQLVAIAMHVAGFGLLAGLVAACAGMAIFGVGFNVAVVRRLVGRPLLAAIMVTLGLGAVIRASSTLAFRGMPGRIPFPPSSDPLHVAGVMVAPEKLVAAVIATACIAVVTWYFRASRTGLALRAIADDQQVAMSMGMDVQRHFSITWAMLGVISVVAGTLWTFAAGGGVGIVLVGLKIFPIVIIGGIDSLPGTIIGAVLVGVLESLAAGYLDPQLGGGFSTIASYLVLIAVLFVRPQGMFGRAAVERV